MTETKSHEAKAHVALRVADLSRSIDFYRKLFAAEPVKVRRAYAKFDLKQPPLNFTLNQSSPDAPPVRGPLSHLGIQLASTEELLAIRERWSRAGLVLREEMQTECCYALQDKVWARDPDGNEWEAFVVLEDRPHEKATEPAACCAPPENTACCAPATQ